MVTFLKIVFILCMLVVFALAVANTLWFNQIPENNRYKSIQAFNVAVLWIVAIFLVIKLVVM